MLNLSLILAILNEILLVFMLWGVRHGALRHFFMTFFDVTTQIFNALKTQTYPRTSFLQVFLSRGELGRTYDLLVDFIHNFLVFLN